MRLAVVERIVLQGLLPSEGNYVLLKVCRDLRDELGFSEEELKALNFQTVALPNGENKMEWNQTLDPNKEVTIGESLRLDIKKRLEELDKNEKLQPNQMSLYEKFVQVEDE